MKNTIQSLPMEEGGGANSVLALSILKVYRVATAQEKRGIWMFISQDRENTENIPKIL